MGDGMVLAKDITAEMKAEYVALLRDGYDVGTAGQMLGSTGHQFKKLRNGGYWHDQEFADQVEAALSDPERGKNRIEMIDEMVWAAAHNGEKWAIEKLAYAYHPDFEKLRHTNLRVSGEVLHAWKLVMPHLSDDELQARIEAAQKPVALLPPAEAA